MTTSAGRSDTASPHRVAGHPGAPGSAPQPRGRQLTLLGVWAHPDDETLLAGGLLADAARRGARVRCLYCTRGEAGLCARGPVSGAELAAIRGRELAAALGRLGVREHRMLDYPDGKLARVPAREPVAVIAAELAAVDPDVVVTFGADGFTGHPDHQQVAAWVAAAAARSGRPGLAVLEGLPPPSWTDPFVSALHAFNAFWPGHPRLAPVEDDEVRLVLNGELLDAKLDALQAHASQFGSLLDAYGAGFFRALGSVERFRRARRGARQEVSGVHPRPGIPRVRPADAGMPA